MLSLTKAGLQQSLGQFYRGRQH